MFPYSVQSIGVTTTRGGVSTREILCKFQVKLFENTVHFLGRRLIEYSIVGLSSNQIFGVNKGFFDPRRPRDKPTKEEQEEGLIPYAPIPDERQMFLTYNREVMHAIHFLYLFTRKERDNEYPAIIISMRRN